MRVVWNKDLDKIKPYVPGKPIEEVKREFALLDVAKLASNESPLPPSPKAVEAIKQAASGVNRYPDGSGFYLKKAISSKINVSEEDIVLGNGSDEVIMMAARAFLSPGDEVVAAFPTFLMYSITTFMEGGTVVPVPMNDMQYDADALLRAVTEKTRIIFIANPNNPTGTAIDKKAFSRLMDNVPDNVIVFIDEAYYEFASRDDDYPVSLSYMGAKKNLIVTRTFSKAYGLAGLRIGYGVAAKEIIDVFNKIRDPFNVNLLAQTAAIAALEDKEYMESLIEMVRLEKKRYYDFFDGLGVKFYKSRTNFVLADTGKDSGPIARSLLKSGVIVREMTAWGLDGFIRVNMGLPRENDRFFKEFKKAYIQ